MKFKEMTWEELKEDFEKFLNQLSTEEIVKSLKKYEVDFMEKLLYNYYRNKK